MKITKIEKQKKNDERVNIYIDDEFAFGLSLEVAYFNFLKKGKEIDQDFIDNILLKEEFRTAKDRALNFLGYRMRTEKEIRDKLKSYEFEDFIIEDVIEFLKNNNFIDDKIFAETFMKDKININNYGPMRIRNDLYLKGIDREIIDEVLSFEEDDSEYNRALEAARKKVNSYRNDDHQKKYRKLYAFLVRRGFSYSIVNDVVKEVLNEE